MAKKPGTKEAEGDSKPGFDLKSHKTRSGKAWADKGHWQHLYDEAYEFAIPYRRPSSKTGKGDNRVERLFDNTAIVSTFRFAGQLQQDLFPPGQAFFKMVPGPVAKAAFKGDIDEWTVELEEISEIIGAFFLTGEFDTAVNEMCVDLAAGTGALGVFEGDDDTPIRFGCIPADEVALLTGAFGEVNGILWKTKMTRRTIRDHFPDGKFPDSFIREHNSGPDDEIVIHQDFIRNPKSKRWDFVAYLDDSEHPIATEDYRTQPIATPRYYRVPGEGYGRGPILLALPTIKTLNKAMELTLKAAAIQMLGIWGFRPGGAFNPDTARMAPGAMWPMQSTGGVLGADVARLDPASGRIDVSQIITQELRLQVQNTLHDDRLPEAGATPRSATEIMARMKRVAQNYLGAFGRLVNEIIPVVVRRVIEILYRRKLLDTNIDIDTLLVKIDVLSPIAAALKATAMTKIIEFMEIVAAIRGPEGLELLLHVDDTLADLGREMGVPSKNMLTKKERDALKKQLAEAAAQMAMNAAAAGGDGQAAPVAA